MKVLCFLYILCYTILYNLVLYQLAVIMDIKKINETFLFLVK